MVALYRVVHLARSEPDSRLLLTAFSDPLAALLQDKLNRLIADQPSLAERIDVLSMSQPGERIHAAQIGKPNLIPVPVLDQLLIDHAPGEISSRYGERFSIEEFREIVDAFHLCDWDSYRDVRRLGRKSRLAEPKRRLLWQAFEAVLQELERRGQISRHQLFHRAAEGVLLNGASPYQHIVVDECQDITAATACSSQGTWANGSSSSPSPGPTTASTSVDARTPSRSTTAPPTRFVSFELLTSGSVRLGTKASLSTMHLAKGLEFRAVAVMACDEDVIPSPTRIEAITDDSDLDEVYATERHLLYVACTRARDHLLITSGGVGSEFLEDMA